jgi:sugar lactone lactonase YvrE
MGATTTAELLLDAGARLGECPRWDGARERLLWVDIDAGLVHDTDPATGTDVVHAIGQKVGALAPRARGGAVLAVATGFALMDPDGAVQQVARVDQPADVIMNDGACDPAGRFWAGTGALDERPGAGALHRLDADLTVTTPIPSVTLSNGIGWSPDGTRMYYVDSGTHGLDVLDFDVAAGTFANRRRLVDVDPADGVPDGLAVDAEGAIWLALWGGGCVRRHLSDGRLDRTVAVPASHVTACALGGPDGTTLYVTTAAGYLDPGERAAQPLAGGLFAVAVDVPGPAATPFAG